MKLGRNYQRLFAASTISNLGDGVALIAYPWLASAVTRNPILIALVATAQRVPWLLFTLPAGVITDRHDRRLLMVGANAGRTALTLFVAVAVLWRSGKLPGPDELDQVTGTEPLLYLCVLAATVLLGIGEVLYDNSAQTFMPSIVATDHLERANGRLWAAERGANEFAGPPLAAVLLAAGFAVPFFFDAGTFAVSAALIFSIAATPGTTEAVERQPWRRELAEGFRWLWRHDLLRAMAITVALMNAASFMTWSIFVLYAQDLLHASSGEYAAIMMAGALGGVLGGWTAPAVIRRIGSGPSVTLTLVSCVLSDTVYLFDINVPIAMVAFFGFAYLVFLWNVVTVSFRQTIIPDRLLGRVNSVYRFFAWGMTAVGSVAGGVIVAVAGTFGDREFALKAPFAVSIAVSTGMIVYALPRLTTAKIEAARAAVASGPQRVVEPAETA